ncbi:type I restriction-modification system subunit M [Desulfobacterales bacterium HSG16]|nr:type I restriction-modification system subunit M [Desulfobacterales bacterium HSG16]
MFCGLGSVGTARIFMNVNGYKDTGAGFMTLDLPLLESWLWDSADILRGSIDSSDYKNYIFGLLFLKRANDVFEEEVEKIVEEKGLSREEVEEDSDFHQFLMPRSARWKFITGKTENIGEAIDKAFADIEEVNTGLEGVMTAVHFGNKDVLTDAILQRLLLHFNKYSLKNRDLFTPDLLGTAYEYLIKMFADDAGKKGGEFYTPKGVVKLIIRLIKPEEKNRVYDPTCGSGGMLIESAKYIAEHGSGQGNLINVSLYGQEKNLGTWAICKINMILHNFPDADIRKGCTLGTPQHKGEDDELQIFDRVIANPPFSKSKWWDAAEVDIKTNEKGKQISPNYNKVVSDPYGRLQYGIPPRGYADLAFFQHMISVLKQGGRLGIVLPHGVLFRAGAEGKIRKGILKDDILEAVVGLPSKLFYNTGIPASIIIVNKTKPKNLVNKVIFIDASNDFKEGKNQNSLEDEHIEKIVDAYDKLKEIEKFMRIVDMKEIEENDYNLNIARYIDTSEEEEPVDLVATLAEIAEIEKKEKGIDEKLAGYLKELGL